MYRHSRRNWSAFWGAALISTIVGVPAAAVYFGVHLPLSKLDANSPGRKNSGEDSKAERGTANPDQTIKPSIDPKKQILIAPCVQKRSSRIDCGREQPVNLASVTEVFPSVGRNGLALAGAGIPAKPIGGITYTWIQPKGSQPAFYTTLTPEQIRRKTGITLSWNDQIRFGLGSSPLRNAQEFPLVAAIGRQVDPKRWAPLAATESGISIQSTATRFLPISDYRAFTLIPTSIASVGSSGQPVMRSSR